MQLLFHIYIATLATAASPHVLHERYVPSMAPGSSPESSSQGAKKLPGVNHKPVVAILPDNANGTATGSLTSKHIPAAVFGAKCRQLTLLGDGKRGQSTLQAACRDGDDDETGLWWLTSLNLNRCLGNEGGKLVFQERGNYDATCRPCGIETILADDDGQVWLRCACLPKPNAVSAAFTEVSLNQNYDGFGIKAVDGRLVCGSHQGTKSPRFGTSSGNGDEDSSMAV